MKVTFVLSSLTLSGGVNVVIEYANRLATSGHRVALVAPGGTTDAAQRAKLHPAISMLESRYELPAKSSPLALAQVTLSMAQTIPHSDVVIATHTPTVVPVIAVNLFQKTRKIWLYMDYLEMFQHRPVERFLLQNAPKWFDAVLTISGAGAQDVAENTGVRARVLTLGLSHPVPVTAPKSKHTVLTILYLGDARPRKGLADFLQAVELLKGKTSRPFQIIIVSKNELSVKTSVPYSIIIAPTTEELGELYRAADIFVSASWAEGFGLPPLEAMAYGTPVVLTDSRGVRDFARNGENCLLVPSRDPSALSESIATLLAKPDLAFRLGEAGRQTATRYNWKNAAAEFEEILRDL